MLLCSNQAFWGRDGLPRGPRNGMQKKTEIDQEKRWKDHVWEAVFPKRRQRQERRQRQGPNEENNSTKASSDDSKSVSTF